MYYIGNANGRCMGTKALKDLVVGVLIGIMSMLPGASGGTIAVVFGIYERLIADVADIRRKLLKDLNFIIPVGIGIVIGLLVCAVGIDALLQDWEVPLMFFFAALIVCQVPDIYRLSNDENDGRPTGSNILAYIVGMIVMVVSLLLGSVDSNISLVELNAVDIVLLFVLGVVITLSKVVPGLSGAAILLAIGLYTPLMSLIGGTDLSVIMDRITAIIPIGIGIIIGAIGLAKIVDHFMQHHRRSTYFCILGLTVGSIITVLVQALQGLDSIIMVMVSFVMIVIGLAFGYVLSRVSTKYITETIKSEPSSA